MISRTWVLVAATCIAAVLAGAPDAAGFTPLAVEDDPLVRMPGTQPADGVSLEAPSRCLNCHDNYDSAVDPGFHWQGSMMSQAARDPLFWAAMTVAAQDSVWLLGRPNATDLCLRCHSPSAWLGGRSDPTNGSALTGGDFDGVSCDGCHRLYDPFYQDTFEGIREGADWSGYWDETGLSSTPSAAAASDTRSADSSEASSLTLFNGSPMYSADRPASSGYTEAASAQYYSAAANEKRASFADATAKHKMQYSRFHKSRYFCGTCHDVSNPALANADFDGKTPGDGTTVLPSEQAPAYSYFHVERTFSEFMLSDYALGSGAPGSGAFAPEVFTTSRPGNVIGSCQDCHMPDRPGVGCDKSGAILRPDGSIEHPNSGQPLHDLTGANVMIPEWLASAVPGSPNYDPEVEALLGQGPAVLTLDLSQGQPLRPDALLAAAERARRNLESAASIENASYDPVTGLLTFRVVNHTGHKLISGYPEGRRMWVTIHASAGGETLIRINPWDLNTWTLKGLDPNVAPMSAPLGPNEQYRDDLVYEVSMQSDLTGEDHTFHFVLATSRYKDNRIPPKGFRIGEAAARMSEPVWQGVSAPDYFTAEEYAGGYDDVSITIPAGAEHVRISLRYETATREYVEFLRNEINGTGGTLPEPPPSGEPSAYIVQTDPFFSGLKAWGDTLYYLYGENLQQSGTGPIQMTEARIDLVPPTCSLRGFRRNALPVALGVGALGLVGLLAGRRLRRRRR